MHGRTNNKIKIKPKRVVARRNDEMLCAFEFVTGFEELEWQLTDNVDTLNVPENTERDPIATSIEIIDDLPDWIAGP